MRSIDRLRSRKARAATAKRRHKPEDVIEAIGRHKRAARQAKAAERRRIGLFARLTRWLRKIFKGKK